MLLTFLSCLFFCKSHRVFLSVAGVHSGIKLSLLLSGRNALKTLDSSVSRMQEQLDVTVESLLAIF